MNNEIKNTNNPRGSGKIIAGIILIGVGAVLVLKNMGYFFPEWLFEWPSLLIVIGLFVGFKNQFRSPAPFILIFIGSVFLISNNFYDFQVRQFLWPAVIIIVGLWMIFGRNRHRNPFNPDNNRFKGGGRFRNRGWQTEPAGAAPEDIPYTETKSQTTSTEPPKSSSAYTGDDYIDSISFFGGVKKRIISKQFKGGEIFNLFGGADIDLTQADFQGRVILDVTQVFGGTKIIVPSNWVVISEMAAIFGGIEDKRHNPTIPQSEDKIIVIKGTSIFAGIDIRSF